MDASGPRTGEACITTDATLNIFTEGTLKLNGFLVEAWSCAIFKVQQRRLRLEQIVSEVDAGAYGVWCPGTNFATEKEL